MWATVPQLAPPGFYLEDLTENTNNDSRRPGLESNSSKFRSRLALRLVPNADRTRYSQQPTDSAAVCSAPCIPACSTTELRNVSSSRLGFVFNFAAN
jgi:hypothetical protein